MVVSMYPITRIFTQTIVGYDTFSFMNIGNICRYIARMAFKSGVCRLWAGACLVS